GGGGGGGGMMAWGGGDGDQQKKGNEKRRLGIPKCRPPRRPVPRCCARSRGLLRGHGSAGHTTAGRVHADRGGSRRDDGPEHPLAVSGIDRDRTDEGAWAGASDGCAIVELIGRSESAGRPPAVA